MCQDRDTIARASRTIPSSATATRRAEPPNASSPVTTASYSTAVAANYKPASSHGNDSRRTHIFNTRTDNTYGKQNHETCAKLRQNNDSIHRPCRPCIRPRTRFRTRTCYCHACTAISSLRDNHLSTYVEYPKHPGSDKATTFKHSMNPVKRQCCHQSAPRSPDLPRRSGHRI
jgi:hypothetical protein